MSMWLACFTVDLTCPTLQFDRSAMHCHVSHVCHGFSICLPRGFTISAMRVRDVLSAIFAMSALRYSAAAPSAPSAKHVLGFVTHALLTKVRCSRKKKAISNQ